MTNFVVRNANDQGTDSLRDAIGKANTNPGADTIVFASNLANSIIHLTSGQLNIANDLTIIGPESGSITIDAGQNSRVFSIDDGDASNLTEVSIKGLTITGGLASDSLASNLGASLASNLGAPRVDNNNHGGGILNLENLTLVDSTVENNYAFDNGGGIENLGIGTLTIKNSIIANNLSQDGGGIYNDNRGTVIIIESDVINNYSVDQGGGIANITGTLLINQSTIAGNTAGTFGGGIDSIGGKVEIKMSSVDSNKANIDGGGIHGENSVIKILMDSEIKNNKSQFDGGGVKVKGGKINIVSSKLVGNIAVFDGGALDTEDTSVYIVNSTIDSNSAADTGGGIRSVGGNLNINSSMIVDNFAGRFAGGVGLGGGTAGSATIYNTSIINNHALAEGGGISNYNQNFILSNSTVSGNLSDNDAGGIANLGNMEIQNSTINNNSAADKGGGIFNYGKLVLTNSIVANSSSGGDIYLTGRGSISVRGKNIIEDGSVTGSGIINVDPLLSPLQNNGGSMLTHIPLLGSPAIDQGVNSLVLIDSFDLDGDGNTTEPIPFDQRGQGYQRIVRGIVDIGAVEVSAKAVSLPFSSFSFIETIMPPLFPSVLDGSQAL